MEFRFLGTSDSGGIPVHNCDCLACESYREKGKINLATCGVLEDEDGVILFDGGAEDLANQFDGKTIKGVCLTHFHGDHALGLLRLRYSKDKSLVITQKMKKDLEIFLNTSTPLNILKTHH